MPKQRNIFQFILNAAIFISLEIAALAMLTNTNSMQNFFLTKGSHYFMAKVWGSSEAVKNYFSLKKTNDQLAMENFRLRSRLQFYQNWEEEIQQQKRTARTSRPLDKGAFEYMPASIIKASRNKQHNFIILDQGYEDGVKEGAGVITDNGVIGIVDAVSKHYSYAISFLNSDFNLSVRLGRDGPVGPLNWSGKSSREALLKEIPLQNKFEPGDTVYTSGYSSIFPAGIPIGTTGDSDVVNGSTYTIDIDLLDDPGSVRYVTLVHCIGTPEIEALEASQVKEEKKR